MTKNKLVVLFVLAVIFGGSNGAFTKIALQEIPAMPLIFLRFVLAGICLLPILYVHWKKEKPTNVGRLTLISFLGTANVALYTVGIQYTAVTSAQILYLAVPVLTVLLSWFMMKQRPNAHKMFGIWLGLVGTATIVLSPHLHDLALGSIKGNLIVLAAVLSFTFYTLLLKKFLPKSSPLTNNFAMIATSVLVLLPFMASFDFRQLAHLHAWTYGSLLWVGVLGTAVYYSLYQYVLKHSDGAVDASLTLYLQPAAAVAFAVPLLGENLTVSWLIGTAISVIGVAYATNKT